MKVEASYVEEPEEDAEVVRAKEISLEEDFCQLVDLQHELKEDVKFTK